MPVYGGFDGVLERWQSGRMRVFAKDVSGQKLDRGFESRPLRLVQNSQGGLAAVGRLPRDQLGLLVGDVHRFSAFEGLSVDRQKGPE
jgi:hypothetical protein